MEMFLCIGRAIHSVSAFQRQRITRPWRDIAHFAQLWARPSSGRARSLLLSAHRRQPQTDRAGFGKWNLRILPLQFYFTNLTTEAGRPGYDRYSVQCSLTGNHLNDEHVLYLDYRSVRFFYPPSFGIASCVGTTGTVTWRLHLTWPYRVALGWVLIWVVSPDCFQEFWHTL